MKPRTANRWFRAAGAAAAVALLARGAAAQPPAALPDAPASIVLEPAPAAPDPGDAPAGPGRASPAPQESRALGGAAPAWVSSGDADAPPGALGRFWRSGTGRFLAAGGVIAALLVVLPRGFGSGRGGSPRADPAAFSPCSAGTPWRAGSTWSC